MGDHDASWNFFTLGRSPPLPSSYDEMKTPVTVDVLEVGWIVAFVTLYVSLLLILPAVKKWEILASFLRVTLALFLGFVVMFVNFGQEWEVGQVEAHMPYRAGSKEDISAKVGLHIGLRGVNITLKATEPPSGDLAGESIDYNERFSWTWGQGRNGFGPFAGEIQREFRAAQYRGVPLPILWVAEMFTFDGEGLRFGRLYRLSGWYAHILIWSAFPTWILCVFFFRMVISYGAIALSLLGSLMVTAALIWAGNRNHNELGVVFGDQPSAILRTHFGYHWYLALIIGLVSIVAGVVVYVLDFFFHNEMCKVLGINPLNLLEEEHGELESESAPSDDAEMKEQGSNQKAPEVVRFRGRGTSRRQWKQNVLPPPPQFPPTPHFPPAPPGPTYFVYQQPLPGQELSEADELTEYVDVAAAEADSALGQESSGKDRFPSQPIYPMT